MGPSRSADTAGPPRPARDGVADHVAPRARSGLARSALIAAGVGVIGSHALGVATVVDLGVALSTRQLGVAVLIAVHVIGAALGGIALWARRGHPSVRRTALFALLAPALSCTSLLLVTAPDRLADDQRRDTAQAVADVRQVWRVVRRNPRADQVESWSVWLSDLVDPEDRRRLAFPAVGAPRPTGPTPWTAAVDAFVRRLDGRPDAFRLASVTFDDNRARGIAELVDDATGRRGRVPVVRRSALWFLSLDAATRNGVASRATHGD